MGILVDMTGRRYGRLVVLESAGPGPDRHMRWRCQCDCGVTVVVIGKNMRQRKSLSCGCHHHELTSQRMTSHGATTDSADSRLKSTYVSWSEMKTRTSNWNRQTADYYVGRGIRCCARWLSSFDLFVSDMGLRPVGMTLDRIDTNGHYEPGNCRWTDPKTQANNTRRNRLLTIDGKTLNLTEWCLLRSMPYHTVKARLNRGWAPALALDTPVGDSTRRGSVTPS